MIGAAFIGSGVVVIGILVWYARTELFPKIFGKEANAVESKDEGFITMEIAGVHTNSARSHFSNLVKVGDVVELVPEPKNLEDPNAIMVKFGRKKLGYVPANKTGLVKQLMETSDVEAFISDIWWDKSNKNYHYLYAYLGIDYKKKE